MSTSPVKQVYNANDPSSQSQGGLSSGQPNSSISSSPILIQGGPLNVPTPNPYPTSQPYPLQHMPLPLQSNVLPMTGTSTLERWRRDSEASTPIKNVTSPRMAIESGLPPGWQRGGLPSEGGSGSQLASREATPPSRPKLLEKASWEQKGGKIRRKTRDYKYNLFSVLDEAYHTKCQSCGPNEIVASLPDSGTPWDNLRAAEEKLVNRT